jgi:hypothetical protein
MATTVTVTDAEAAILSRYYADMERNAFGRQLTSYLLQLSHEYGVYGGGDGGNYAGLAGVSFDPANKHLVFDATDTKSGDQHRFAN